MLVKFEFEGITYEPVKYEGASSLQCERCDLKIGRRKICLNNSCDCGNCGLLGGNDKYIFKATNITNDYREHVEEERENYKIELLEKEILCLEEEKKKLVSFSSQLVKKNTALIREINKYKKIIGEIKASIKLLMELG